MAEPLTSNENFKQRILREREVERYFTFSIELYILEMIHVD